jgi:uncharacterized NAD-dependent epimerase/dehydratase family protein
MKGTAIVYSENEFGKLDGKVANGLARQSDSYEIVGIIDSTKSGCDAGLFLDGIKNHIPVFNGIEDSIDQLDTVPDYFIYGIAPLTSFLSKDQREVILLAMKMGMNIVNGLPQYLTDDEEFISQSLVYGVTINDVRKPPLRKDQHNFTGKINNVTTPVINVMGTDCAVGKRTTALKLVEALRKEGLKAVFITTGQTGLLQGSKYGIALDVLTSGYATGELENAIIRADEEENPDIIIVEGQGALSHPAFTSSSAIVKGAMPDAIIMQHPPKRMSRCDYPEIPMPTLKSEIELMEVFSKAKVIAITLNHEDMTDDEVSSTIVDYEKDYELPTTDVLKFGSEKLVQKIYEVFPELINIEPLLWQPQE